eukprot:c27689_g1_i1.p1 GENE.c27689_g1_i1~~c27689_g1_i1.p1  ORF type:complete len:111 (+),score=6.05 c27689_g1_i1:557-889(+)
MPVFLPLVGEVQLKFSNQNSECSNKYPQEEAEDQIVKTVCLLSVLTNGTGPVYSLHCATPAISKLACVLDFVTFFVFCLWCWRTVCVVEIRLVITVLDFFCFARLAARIR